VPSSRHDSVDTSRFTLVNNQQLLRFGPSTSQVVCCFNLYTASNVCYVIGFHSSSLEFTFMVVVVAAVVIVAVYIVFVDLDSVRFEC